jgi:glycerol-3-phosphate dehydrogenase (NAD+)
MGGGNFGIALAAVCARKGMPTTLLVRSEEIALAINNNHSHPRYMTDIKLPNALRATSKPEECLPDATFIIHTVPVQYSRAFLESVAEHIPPNTPVLSGSKGIETSSLGFMAEILKEALGADRPYAFLSGPSFAREICEGVATAVVIAAEDLLLARDLAELLSDESFRCFTTRDVMGVEIGGAVKNVIALAAGMCEGLGLGTNAMSGLVTRGCGEMRRLGVFFGARPSTIAGLSGRCGRLSCRLWVALFCFVCVVFGYIVPVAMSAPSRGHEARSCRRWNECLYSHPRPYLLFYSTTDRPTTNRRRRYLWDLLWTLVTQPQVWLPTGSG